TYDLSCGLQKSRFKPKRWWDSTGHKPRTCWSRGSRSAWSRSRIHEGSNSPAAFTRRVRIQGRERQEGSEAERRDPRPSYSSKSGAEVSADRSAEVKSVLSKREKENFG